MTTPQDVVKDIYRAFSEGDLDGVIKLCAEDIEWVVNGPTDLEKCQAFHGRNGVQQFFDILGSIWEFSSFTPRQFIVQDNTVIVLGEETGRDIKMKTPFENRWVHVFDIKDGQLIRFREFLCCWFGEHTPPTMSWETA